MTMLQSHKDNNASLTVAVLDVPLKEASRFGIMNTDANNRIVELKKSQHNQNLQRLLWVFTSLIGNVCAICLLLLKRAMSICQTLVRMSFQITLSQVKVSMPMNLMVTGKMLVRLNRFWEANMEYISPEMPWIAVTVNGRFTQET